MTQIIIHDVDETLIKSDKIVQANLINNVFRKNLKIPKGINENNIKQFLIELLTYNNTTTTEFYSDYTTIDLLDEYKNGHLRPYEDAVWFLKNYDKHIHFAISNSNQKYTEEKLALTGIDAYIEKSMARSDEYSKPNPYMGLKILNDIQEVQYHAILNIGDSPLDMFFGHNLKTKGYNITNVQISREKMKKNKHADRIVSSYYEISDIMADLEWKR